MTATPRKRNPKKSKARTPVTKKTSPKKPPSNENKPKKPFGRPVKVSPSVMKKSFDAYFKQMTEEKRPFTVPGLALSVGLTRQGLWQYSSYPDFVDTLTKALARIETQRAEKLVTSGQPVAGIIFDLKNNFKWKDTQEVRVEATVTVNARDLDDRVEELDHE